MKLFAYDSKPMQILAFLGDLMILNFLYLICCIPVFTIGAAQAGMFTGLRILTDPEDDSSAAAAFLRGFKNGFGKITIAWLIATVVVVCVGFASIGAVAYGMPTWFVIVALCIVALFQSLIAPFHSRFDCTVWRVVGRGRFDFRPFDALLRRGSRSVDCIGYLCWFGYSDGPCVA